MLPEPTNLVIGVEGSHMRLRGDLDMETAESLVAAAERLIVDGHRDLVVDCAGLTFCDSYGLRALQRISELVEPNGSASIARPSPTLTRILTITGLVASFTILETDGHRADR